MDCKEAAEFVSALYDGETIPRTAAEHIGDCEVCKARLKSYMEIGVELRRTASLYVPEAAQPRLWDKPQWSLKIWWKKGWETMRIPRLAFAVMSAGIVVLASSLAVVGVRAHSDGTVVMLKVTLGSGHPSTPCPLSTTDKKNDVCGAVAALNEGIITYKWKLLQKEGNRVQLGFRSKLDPKIVGSGSYSFSAVDDLPEKQYWFEPGETLEVDLPNNGKMSVTGEWMDHIPAFYGQQEDSDPGPGQLRVRSPLLLRDKTVAGDFEGGSAVADEVGKGVDIYMPGEGRFRFSLSPFKGAIEGRLKLNRITFESNGQPYVLITSTPIARGETVWVLHEPNFKPSGELSKSPYIGAGNANQPE